MAPSLSVAWMRDVYSIVKGVLNYIFGSGELGAGSDVETLH